MIDVGERAVGQQRGVWVDLATDPKSVAAEAALGDLDARLSEQTRLHADLGTMYWNSDVPYTRPVDPGNLLGHGEMKLSFAWNQPRDSRQTLGQRAIGHLRSRPFANDTRLKGGTIVEAVDDQTWVARQDDKEVLVHGRNTVISPAYDCIRAEGDGIFSVAVGDRSSQIALLTPKEQAEAAAKLSRFRELKASRNEAWSSFTNTQRWLAERAIAAHGVDPYQKSSSHGGNANIFRFDYLGKAVTLDLNGTLASVETKPTADDDVEARLTIETPHPTWAVPFLLKFTEAASVEAIRQRDAEHDYVTRWSVDPYYSCPKPGILTTDFEGKEPTALLRYNGDFVVL